MDAASRFIQSLDRARGTKGSGSLSVKAAHGGAELEMEISDADRLGILATKTHVTAGPGAADDQVLATQADEMIRRVTYLQESLALIELDRRRCRAVLRSANPRVAGDTLDYYEAVLESGRSATLRRYRYERGRRARRPIAANLSTETAARLAGDLLDIFARK